MYPKFFKLGSIFSKFWDSDRFFKILALGSGLGSIFQIFGIGLDFILTTD